VAALLGAAPVAWPLFTGSVAYAAAAGKRSWAAAIGLAGLTAMTLRFGSPSAAGQGIGWAVLGVLLGVSIRRRWTMRATVAAAGACVFALWAWPAVRWEQWVAQHQAYIESLEAQLMLQADAESQRDQQALEMIGAFKEHWPLYGAGLYAGAALFFAAVGVTLLGRWVRRGLGMKGLRGGFGHLRTPDWFVWVAIGVAGMHFAGSAWPNETLTAAKWNAAAAVLAAYMLNGLSIVVYGARTVGMHWAVAALMALMILYWSPSLGVIGFVDTWAEFRRKLARVAAARARDAADKDGAS
jgi:hypothetical protein